MTTLPFKNSEAYTLGVELELQVLNSRDYNLTGGAADLLALLENVPHPGEIKPEITEGMIEISYLDPARLRRACSPSSPKYATRWCGRPSA